MNLALVRNYTKEIEPLALRTYTANLGSLYTHDNSFTNATELATEVHPSSAPYAKDLALSDPEDTKVVGMNNKEETDSGDEDYEDECTDDDYDNEDEGSDDDYEKLHVRRGSFLEA